MASLQQDLLAITDSIGRGKGSFGLSRAPSGQPTLVLGAPTAVKVPKGGFIVCLGLTREQVQTLRDQCDEILATGTK